MIHCSYWKSYNLITVNCDSLLVGKYCAVVRVFIHFMTVSTDESIPKTATILGQGYDSPWFNI